MYLPYLVVPPAWAPVCRAGEKNTEFYLFNPTNPLGTIFALEMINF